MDEEELLLSESGPLGGLAEMLMYGGTTTPEAREYAARILDEYDPTDFGMEEGILSQMQDTAAQTRQALQEARRRLVEINQGRSGERWMAMGAGFLRPTQTGTIGESLGYGLGALTQATQADKTREADLAGQLLEIDTALAGTDQPVYAAQFELEKLRRQIAGRMAQEALRTLGRRVPGSTTGLTTEREIQRYYDQLTRMGVPDQQAYDRAVSLAYDKTRLEVVEGLGVVRGVDEITGQAWEVPLDAARNAGLVPGATAAGRESQYEFDLGRETPSDIRDVVPDGQLTLWDAALSGTGLWSGIAAGYNIPAGWFGLPRARQVTLARQALRSETQPLIRAISLNPRYPVGEVQRIERELSLLPQLLDNPPEMRDRMRVVDASLRTRYQQDLADAEDVSLPLEVRSAAEQTAAAIRRFLPILGVPQERAPRRSGGSRSPTASQSTLVEPSATSSEVDQELEALLDDPVLSNDPILQDILRELEETE